MTGPHLCRVAIAMMAATALIASRDLSAQSVPSPLGSVDRLVVASKIYATIEQYFAHWESAPRAEVEAAYRDYVAAIVGSTSRKDFDLATLRFVARLRNGHTQFVDGQLDRRPIGSPSACRPARSSLSILSPIRNVRRRRLRRRRRAG